jgi:hypothetical protein
VNAGQVSSNRGRGHVGNGAVGQPGQPDLRGTALGPPRLRPGEQRGIGRERQARDLCVGAARDLGDDRLALQRHRQQPAVGAGGRGRVPVRRHRQLQDPAELAVPDPPRSRAISGDHVQTVFAAVV